MLTLASASIWIILRNTVRLGRAIHPVCQYPLVPQQVGQSRLKSSDRQRPITHRYICMLPPYVGFIPHLCLLSRCVDGLTRPTVILDGVQLLAITAASHP